MNERTLTIPNISCGHCVMAVKNELTDLDGVNAVDGDAETKKVTVKWDAPATEAQIRDVLAKMNYPAAE